MHRISRALVAMLLLVGTVIWLPTATNRTGPLYEPATAALAADNGNDNIAADNGNDNVAADNSNDNTTANNSNDNSSATTDNDNSVTGHTTD